MHWARLDWGHPSLSPSPSLLVLLVVLDTGAGGGEVVGSCMKWPSWL